MTNVSNSIFYDVIIKSTIPKKHTRAELLAAPLKLRNATCILGVRSEDLKVASARGSVVIVVVVDATRLNRCERSRRHHCKDWQDERARQCRQHCNHNSSACCRCSPNIDPITAVLRTSSLWLKPSRGVVFQRCSCDVLVGDNKHWDWLQLREWESANAEWVDATAFHCNRHDVTSSNGTWLHFRLSIQPTSGWRMTSLTECTGVFVSIPEEQSGHLIEQQCLLSQLEKLLHS